MNETMMNTRPPLGLRNRHINTIFGNNGPRKWLVALRAKALNAASEEVVLSCGDGVQLHGVYTPGRDVSRGMVVLLHGWEGSASSTYLQSAAIGLFEQGFSIFRLHMRDHGPSHHLNHDPFLAIRLDEILDAMEQICALYPHEYVGLAGFSLGANLVVRVAANVSSRGFKLDQAVAISPPIDPEKAAHAIQKYFIYNRYFCAKWQSSFEKKIALFDDYKAHADLLDHTDILAMHEDFVPRFSNHATASSYFAAYALNGHNLKRMEAPCRIIMVEDDPVIPIESSAALADLEGLTLEVVPFGGHCGFISDYRLNSWLDGRLVELFS